RHWLSRRAALTRPNFGTAISMSNTFAVETYSGGSRRICSIETAPDFRSFFNWARLTRMSFARLSASMRWSSERTGAWTWVWGGTMDAASYQPVGGVQLPSVGASCLEGQRYRARRRTHPQVVRARRVRPPAQALGARVPARPGPRTGPCR